LFNFLVQKIYLSRVFSYVSTNKHFFLGKQTTFVPCIFKAYQI